jgi:hypothetical protein
LPRARREVILSQICGAEQGEQKRLYSHGVEQQIAAGVAMGSKAFPPQIECPELLNQQALQLSFTLLREINPALALRIRNAAPASDDCQPLSRSALPSDCVREVVTALSQRSKQDDLSAAAEELVTLRKLLLIWMEYQRQQLTWI